MLTLVARTATALSLMLSASVAAPAWSAGNSVDERKCTNARHVHAKRAAPAPVRKAAPARSVMVVEKRKMDVQILSFGP